MYSAASSCSRGQADSKHATPDREDTAHTSSQRSAVCHTPQECATMLEAMEQAMQHAAQECTPDSHPAHDSKASNLQDWLKTSGLQIPTPAARDLQALVEAAADNRRLRKQLEALREAELELAAREAEETALNFSMLEEENSDLAVKNAQLQQRITELEALAAAAEAAEAAAQMDQQQQRDVESPEPSTPQHQRLRMLGLGGEDASMQELATSVLKRAAAASRLSGMYQEEHQAKLRELSEAEGRLSAVKSQAPASTQSQQSAMQERLTAAEQQVQEAAEAAQAATAMLQAVLQEKEEVQGELAALRQQMEAQPNAAQHAELYAMLLEAQQQMRQQKQLAGSLLEHAGRLSHKYYNLSDDYDALEQRYQQLSRANEHLAGQLKEAHETLYEVQTTVQATPVHKRQHQQHLMARLRGAEEAVMSLTEEKQQLQERLLQAHAFISCIQQRTRAPATAAPPPDVQQQQHNARALVHAPDCAAALTPLVAGAQSSTASAAVAKTSRGTVLALPAPAAAAGSTPRSDLSASVDALASKPAGPPARGNSRPLLNAPASSETHPGSHVTAQVRDGLLSCTWPEPVSPILAAAARSRTAGEQRQREHRSAASHELQEVQVEQLGLRQEISRAKSALADIAGQLRASIGSQAAAAAAGSSRGATSGASNSASLGLAHSSRPAAAASGGNLGSVVWAGEAASAVRPARQAASSKNSGSSGSSSSEASRSGTHGSKAASGGRSHGPGKLQELAKAAAAVRTVSAARSGNSSRSTSQAVANPPSVSSSQARGAGTQSAAAVRRAGGQWDQLTDSDSTSSGECSMGAPSGGVKPAASAPAAAAPGLVLPAGTTAASGSAAASQGTIGSRIRAAACLSAPAAAASGSAGGSLSLDQLIADAESVSLEYGMSPGGYRAGSTAAADATSRDVAAAAAQYTPAVGQGSCSGSAAAGGSSVTPQQVAGRVPFAFAASQMGLTPGSAASSAGAGAAKAAQHWGPTSQQHQWDLTPASLAVPAAQPADMQSCMRKALSSRSHLADWQQQSAPAATPGTPAGLERVGSNTMLGAPGDAVEPLVAQQLPQQSAQEQQQQLLELPADATPTNVGGVRVAVSGGDGGPNSVQQRDQGAGTAAHPGVTDSAQSSVASALPAESSMGVNGSTAVQQRQNTPQQQQQQECPEQVTPVKASSGRPLAPGDTIPAGADVASPPSALKRAAAALLSSISPAGLMTSATPVTAAGRTPAASAAAAAAASLAGALSPQLLQHLTPEWLRSLKRKCKQESEQLQQLRRQMGLATPEAVLAAQQQQQLQGSTSKGVQGPAAVASPAVTAQDGTPSARGGGVPQALSATPPGSAAVGGVGSSISTPAPCNSANTGGNSAYTPLAALAPADAAAAAAAAAGSNSKTPLAAQAPADAAAAVAAGTAAAGSNNNTPLALLAPAEAVGACTAAGHGGTCIRAAPAASHTATSSSLGQLSSRSSIDRLRRRAIMAQATAAAAGDVLTSDAAAGAVEAAVPAGVHDLAAAAAAAKVAVWVAVDAASHEEHLDRSSSAGSLADYIRQNSWQHEDLSAPVSRTGSITPSMLLMRPECPTPGSMYSDIAGNEALPGADNADAQSGRGSVSPDMLLAGLRSSRLAARQLQHQLLQQLEKTNSMPSVLPRQHEAALGAVLASEGPPRTTSAAAAEAAAAARAPAATVMEFADDADCCDSPALQASTRLVPVADEEGPSPAGGSVEQYGSPGAQLLGSGALTDGAALQHRQLARLLDEQPAAGSPATPGAALNAGAESRLLSPGTELQLVFDSSDDASPPPAAAEADTCTADAAAAFDLQSELIGHQRGDSVGGSSSGGRILLRQQEEEQRSAAVLLPAAASPQPSESSSCMVPLGVAAKAQPEAEAAFAAPSPPTSVLTVTPGVSGPQQQRSIRAHQLSSWSAGTLTPSAVTQPLQEVSQTLSSGHALLQSSAQTAACSRPSSAVSSAAHSGLRTSVPKPSATADSSSRSSMHGCSQAAGRSAGQMLGSSAGLSGPTGAGAGCMSGAETPASAAASSVSRGSATVSGFSVSQSAVGAAPSSVRQQQEVPCSADVPIMLGESPSSKPGQQQKQRSALLSGDSSRAFGPAAAADAAAAAATPGSASITSDSCMSGPSGPRLSLGSSPGSAQGGMLPAAAAQEATPTSAAAAAAVAAATVLGSVGGGTAAAAAAADTRLAMGAAAGGYAQGAAPSSAAAAAAGNAAAARVPSPAVIAMQPSPAASGTAGLAAAAAGDRGAHRNVTPEAEAAASAAIAAAFAMPKLNPALHPRPLAAAGMPAAAAAPAASGTSWGSGSCMFATPAAAFNSAGGAACGVTSDGSGQQYYTGQQGSSSISSKAVTTTAATSRPRHTEASCSSAEGADAAAETAARAAVAFAGFRVPTAPDQAAAGTDPPLSPVMGGASKAPAAAGPVTGADDPVEVAAGAVSSVGQQLPAVTATAQKRMVHELLGSPSSEASEDSCMSESLDPPSPGSGDLVLPAPAAADPAVVQSAAAVAAAAGCESPGRGDASVTGSQSPEAPSPTLSVLGFVEASASADVAATKRLQRQQQQAQQELEGGRARAADLAGLSFEQRLELLCAEDGSSSDASTSPQSLASPAGIAAAAAEAAGGSNSLCGSLDESSDAGVAARGCAEDEGWCDGRGQAVDCHAGSSSRKSAGVQQSGSMACCATQTTPLPYGAQGGLRVREASTQVPTPAHPPARPLAQKAEADSTNPSKSVSGPLTRPCDVLASPIKGRDQERDGTV